MAFGPAVTKTIMLDSPIKVYGKGQKIVEK